MKEIYLTVTNDNQGKYVAMNGKKHFLCLCDSDISPITQKVDNQGHNVIKCLLLVNGRRLAVPIPD